MSDGDPVILRKSNVLVMSCVRLGVQAERSAGALAHGISQSAEAKRHKVSSDV